MASFEKRGNTWRAIIRRGTIQKKRTFDTKKEAVAWARQIEAEIDGGQGAAVIARSEAAKTSLADIFDRYGREVSPLKKSGTRELYALANLKKELGHLPASMLTSTVVAAFRDRRITKCAAATVNRELNILSAVLNHARREWRIGVENPVQDIRRPKNPKGRERRLSAEEELCLLKALSPRERREDGTLGTGAVSRWTWLVVRFALETAMRQSEILSLEWQNINGPVATLPDTKNGTRRAVPLSPRAMAVLRLAGWGTDRYHGLVFDASRDLIKRAFTRGVERARKRYEEEGGRDPQFLCDLHFHDLRHEATSRLANRLPNLIELASVTGHQDLRMLRRYYHTKPEELAKKLRA